MGNRLIPSMKPWRSGLGRIAQRWKGRGCYAQGSADDTVIQASRQCVSSVWSVGEQRGMAGTRKNQEGSDGEEMSWDGTDMPS